VQSPADAARQQRVERRKRSSVTGWKFEEVHGMMKDAEINHQSTLAEEMGRVPSRLPVTRCQKWKRQTLAVGLWLPP